MTAKQRSKIEEQTIALAGVIQAAKLVDQVSKTGSYPLEFLEPSINSLFNFEAERVEEVYGGVAGVKLGLHNMVSLLSNRETEQHREVVRYLFNLLYLEQQFRADANMMAVVRSRLEHTSFRAEHFSTHVNDLCGSVSGIYQDTLSKLKFRIKVSGSAQHLQNTQNADMIRALLLAGIRSAFLWRQLGGRRWKLLFQRKALLRCAQQLSRDLSLV
ncbi:high frequency lysogenization protein HflD [Parahaliea sp. F7430]|uniref:High frequency lysogenization protein HflD homolog n=1 Tax=Sediminihaliea albiluteola TaxID=2758564 RepID=A0A7W2YIB1_9GAMM|nr:high frequency lysogenization protein HflD [Sediminihaliea albiluteola]MBA6412326.1 high frequency lysogenization protein HflD [Sediminihaliea albiluteola]